MYTVALHERIQYSFLGLDMGYLEVDPYGETSAKGITALMSYGYWELLHLIE